MDAGEVRPLHVQVAEALGCETARKDVIGGPWFCDCEAWDHSISAGPLARYDTDWQAAGPLIERYGIAIEPLWKVAPDDDALWEAYVGCDAFGEDQHACIRRVCGSYTGTEGSTALIAVCNLILALKAAGKL